MKKPSKKIPWTKLSVEFVSIFLSVLLALAANEWRDNRNQRKICQKGVESIYAELKENYNMIDKAHQSHLYFKGLIDSLITTSSFDSESAEKALVSGIDIEFAHNVAWEAARITNITSSMDIDLVGELADIYNGQEIYNSAGQRVIDELFLLQGVEVEIIDKELLITVRNLLAPLIHLEKQLLIKYQNFLV